MCRPAPDDDYKSGCGYTPLGCRNHADCREHNCYAKWRKQQLQVKARQLSFVFSVFSVLEAVLFFAVIAALAITLKGCN